MIGYDEQGLFSKWLKTDFERCGFVPPPGGSQRKFKFPAGRNLIAGTGFDSVAEKARAGAGETAGT
jgi:hypothetical protein